MILKIQIPGHADIQDFMLHIESKAINFSSLHLNFFQNSSTINNKPAEKRLEKLNKDYERSNATHISVSIQR